MKLHYELVNYELVNYELVSQVGKLQLHKLVAIEFAPSNGKKFKKKTFANEYFLPF